jgi:uncharacterized protein
MRYNVAQLLKGQTGAQRRYDLSEEIGHLDPELEPVEPLVGSLVLMRTSQGVLATGRFHTSLRAECRRCLEPCTVDAEFDLEEEFYPVVLIGEVPVDDVPKEERDEALSIDENHILDLSEVMRQALWLATPRETLCRSDCSGLCPDCGENRNLRSCTCNQVPVDPRWATLQELLPAQSDSEERSD